MRILNFLLALLYAFQPANASVMLLKQSTAASIPFFMTDSSDHVTGKTGATVTCTLSKNAGSFGASGGSVSEISSGWYYLAANTTDTGTLGALAQHCTATGADPSDFLSQVVADLPGATVSSVSGAVGSVSGAVGSVTGAVGSVTGNVGGNVVGSVASVTGAVGSVTGAVGSVTGNVGGNVVGSVASVAGAVGSVTGNVGGNVTGSVGSVVGNLGGNVTGTVASVVGNVGGNVVGSVASVTAGVTVTTNNDKTGYSLASASIPIKKNTLLPNFQFPMIGSTSGAPASGLTVTCQRSIDGGSFATCANAVGAISNGYYKITFAASDLNGDTILVRFTATGAKEKSITFLTQ